MNTEKEYMKIGKAVLNECIARAGERCISITLRSVQVGEKLYLRLEDIVEPISIWSFTDLTAICEANRQQRIRAREAIGEVETIIIELIPKSKERGGPKAVEVE
jgi:hypothetical protein